MEGARAAGPARRVGAAQPSPARAFVAIGRAGRAAAIAADEAEPDERADRVARHSPSWSRRARATADRPSPRPPPRPSVGRSLGGGGVDGSAERRRPVSAMRSVRWTTSRSDDATAVGLGRRRSRGRRRVGRRPRGRRHRASRPPVGAWAWVSGSAWAWASVSASGWPARRAARCRAARSCRRTRTTSHRPSRVVACGSCRPRCSRSTTRRVRLASTTSTGRRRRVDAGVVAGSRLAVDPAQEARDVLHLGQGEPDGLAAPRTRRPASPSRSASRCRRRAPGSPRPRSPRSCPGHGPLAPAAGGGLTPSIVATARTAAATVRARQPMPPARTHADRRQRGARRRPVTNAPPAAASASSAATTTRGVAVGRRRGRRPRHRSAAG